MAKVTSTTTRLELKSRTTGVDTMVLVRAWYRTDKIDGRVIRTMCKSEIKDTHGQRFERMSDAVLRCIATGEQFYVM